MRHSPPLNIIKIKWATPSPRSVKNVEDDCGWRSHPCSRLDWQKRSQHSPGRYSLTPTRANDRDGSLEIMAGGGRMGDGWDSASNLLQAKYKARSGQTSGFAKTLGFCDAWPTHLQIGSWKKVQNLHFRWVGILAVLCWCGLLVWGTSLVFFGKLRSGYFGEISEKIGF